MCCIKKKKGGRDLCVKLGLNTPGEEGRARRTPELTCELGQLELLCAGEGNSICLCAYGRVFECVFVCVSTHPNCNRRMFRFKGTP